jgi:4-carboxymuconolactone decarboxylase
MQSEERWNPGMTKNRHPRRLAGLTPHQLSSSQRRLYEDITEGRRGQGPQHFPLLDDEGRLRGPFNAMLLSPSIGDPLQKLGSAVRFGSALSDRERELAILVVASHWKSAFEQAFHEAVGAAVGLSQEEMIAVASGEPIITANEREMTLVDLARRLVSRWSLDDEEWECARDAVGEPLLFELTVLVGYYSMLALQLRVFVDDDHRLQDGNG